MNVAVIIHTCKYGHKWVFAFDEDNEQQRKKLVRRLGMFAANGELTFDWFDAAKVCKLIRETAVVTKHEKVERNGSHEQTL